MVDVSNGPALVDTDACKHYLCRRAYGRGQQSLKGHKPKSTLQDLSRPDHQPSMINTSHELPFPYV